MSKRRINPGKTDRRNPPPPQSQYNDTATIFPDIDHTNTDHMLATFLAVARKICDTPHDDDDRDNQAIWCLRELMTYVKHPLEPIFANESFREKAQYHHDTMIAHRAQQEEATTPPPVNDAATQTPPPTPPPARTYAEAATQVIPQEIPPPIMQGSTKGKEKEEPASPAPQVRQNCQSKRQAGPSTAAQSQKALAPQQTPLETPNAERRARTASQAPPQARAVVLHAAPTKYKPGQMRRWIEEDNKGTGAQILGIRWLTQEHRRVGKLASSLVIYMKESIDLNQGLRMGRKLFRTTGYDWDR